MALKSGQSNQDVRMSLKWCDDVDQKQKHKSNDLPHSCTQTLHKARCTTQTVWQKCKLIYMRTSHRYMSYISSKCHPVRKTIWYGLDHFIIYINYICHLLAASFSSFRFVLPHRNVQPPDRLPHTSHRNVTTKKEQQQMDTAQKRDIITIDQNQEPKR